MTRLIACILTLALASAAIADVTTVHLRTGARVAPDAPVTVADLADVEGPQGDAIGSLVVIEDLERARGTERFATVEVDRVHELIQNMPSVRMGSISITGGTCMVGPRVIEPKTPVPAAPPARPAPEPTGPTVRSSLLDHLRAFFAVEAHELRVTFDPRDDEALDTPIAGRTVEIRSLGSSRRMPFAVTLYDGDRVALNTTVRAEVEILRPVAVATRRVARGAAVAPEDIAAEQRWMGVDEAPPTPEDVLGRIVKRRLETGSPVAAGDIEQPIAVQRGDIASIRSVVGTAVVRTRARALANGSVGDVIEFESSDRGARFLARVDGPGRAVVAPATLSSQTTP